MKKWLLGKIFYTPSVVVQKKKSFSLLAIISRFFSAPRSNHGGSRGSQCGIITRDVPDFDARPMNIKTSRWRTTLRGPTLICCDYLQKGKEKKASTATMMVLFLQARTKKGPSLEESEE